MCSRSISSICYLTLVVELGSLLRKNPLLERAGEWSVYPVLGRGIMPILGMSLSDELVKQTKQALARELDDPVIRVYTKAERVIVHREAYTGNYILTGFNSADRFFLIGKFAMLPMPGCRGVVIFHHVEVEPRFRRMGLGETLLKIRMKVAKEVGYSLAMATVRADNTTEGHLLAKTGWQNGRKFTNARTGHELGIWMVKL